MGKQFHQKFLVVDVDGPPDRRAVVRAGRGSEGEKAGEDWSVVVSSSSRPPHPPKGVGIDQKKP